ncbi:hypothetical protein BDU57DRAFT_525017 [Ampelomyces quisqualis]|uniref:Uncharacterized protein n=1 Tax=Ampelomyces quisqualis TaxID=50730 RepID=A0A6A5Q827_AMPQU|nr:hypothetical protein BDU57DRAFT_525017 [Ampelomyces quisqualis]
MQKNADRFTHELAETKATLQAQLESHAPTTTTTTAFKLLTLHFLALYLCTNIKNKPSPELCSQANSVMEYVASLQHLHTASSSFVDMSTAFLPPAWLRGWAEKRFQSKDREREWRRAAKEVLVDVEAAVAVVEKQGGQVEMGIEDAWRWLEP